MIYFCCTACKEELEAEDSIRGTRMECPACSKDIEVPLKGMRPTETLRGARTAAAALPGRRFILAVLGLGLAGVLLATGIGYTLHRRALDQRQKSRPRCGPCEARGQVPCAVCTGSRKQGCKECSGSGRRKNFREEEEKCYLCAGTGALDCPICGAI